jgi:two-component system nitrogen regulation response regulator NtrX
MAQELILIIDDEENIRDSLSEILKDEGYRVITAASGEEAVAVVRENMPDIALLDVWLPKMNGIETMQSFKASGKNFPVIMISGHANIELAVEATRLGAYDFLEKPLSLEKVLIVIKRSLELKKLEEENRALKGSLSKKWNLIGNSEKMNLLRQQTETAAKSNSRVLILGESGTGKEIIARLLHDKSPRAAGDFIEVNCAAIPQELIESELFGHEKGSFTGASERKTGKFELADKGTLFLDEIGDMAIQTQAKVLRVIETQMFQRVGGSKNIEVDVRVIAATNKDLPEEVKKGNFREDLYFRLNVIPIKVPPLRERLGDIPMLIEHFVEMLSAENSLKPKRFSAESIAILQNYSWPGNIRELKNAIERLLIMTASQTISPDDIWSVQLLGEDDAQRGYSYLSYGTLREARDAFEKDFIIRKLRENGWNISKTAESIDVERSNLHKKIKSYNITEQTV